MNGWYRKQILGSTQQSQPYDPAAIMVVIQILIIQAVFKGCIARGFTMSELK
jgi:hypothetical protein